MEAPRKAAFPLRRAIVILWLTASGLCGGWWVAAVRKAEAERDSGFPLNVRPAPGPALTEAAPPTQAVSGSELETSHFDPDLRNASADFEPVPDWIPRPPDARDVRVHHATLRSDGLQEGEIAYTLEAGPVGAIAWARAALEAAGLQPAAGERLNFASPSLTRRCRVDISSPDGSTVLTLTYTATNHQSGCACPTCQGAPPASPSPP
jgi:hypothetical protein